VNEREKNIMGLFSKLFGSSSDIEKRLEYSYVTVMKEKMQMSESKARKIVRDTIQHEKEVSMREGTFQLPLNNGDRMLEQEFTKEEIKSQLVKKRKEGVRDDDIRWWWNMHDLERRMIVAFDSIIKMWAYKVYTETDGLSEKDAIEKLNRHFPIWGDPDDITHFTEDDRPLPFELKDRVNLFVEKRRTTDPEGFNKAMESSSSLNALIRKLIKRGQI
jgi:hypothetical protein